jgi:hypothetical protein
MSAPNDGGPAFPLSPGNMLLEYNGMSLRDYFAGQALAGLLHRHEGVNAAVWATAAYELADAMLAARAQEPEQ